MQMSIPNYGKPNSGFDPLLWKNPEKTVGEGATPVTTKKRKEHPMVKFVSGSSSFNQNDKTTDGLLKKD